MILEKIKRQRRIWLEARNQASFANEFQIRDAAEKELKFWNKELSKELAKK